MKITLNFVAKERVLPRLLRTLHETCHVLLFICFLWSFVWLVTNLTLSFIPDKLFLSIYDLGLAEPTEGPSDVAPTSLYSQLINVVWPIVLGMHLWLHEKFKVSTPRQVWYFVTTLTLSIVCALVGLSGAFFSTIGLGTALMSLVFTVPPVLALLGSIATIFDSVKVSDLGLLPAHLSQLGISGSISPLLFLLYSCVGICKQLVGFIQDRISKARRRKRVLTETNPISASYSSHLSLERYLVRTDLKFIMFAMGVMILASITLFNGVMLAFYFAYHFLLPETMDFASRIFIPRVEAVMEEPVSDETTREIAVLIVGGTYALSFFHVFLGIMSTLVRLLKDQILQKTRGVAHRRSHLRRFLRGLVVLTSISPPIILIFILHFASHTHYQFDLINSFILNGSFPFVFLLLFCGLILSIVFITPSIGLIQAILSRLDAKSIDSIWRSLNISKKNGKDAIFLRSFRSDEVFPFRDFSSSLRPIALLNPRRARVESLLALAAAEVYRMKAYGNPDADGFGSGIARISHGKYEWREKFARDVVSCDAIFVLADTTDSLLWEIDFVSKSGVEGEVFVLFPPDSRNTDLQKTLMDKLIFAPIGISLDKELYDRCLLFRVNYLNGHTAIYLSTGVSREEYFSAIWSAMFNN